MIELFDTVTVLPNGCIHHLTCAFFANVGPASGKSAEICNVTTPGRLLGVKSIHAVRFQFNTDIARHDLDSITARFWPRVIVSGLGYRVTDWHPLVATRCFDFTFRVPVPVQDSTVLVDLFNSDQPFYLLSSVDEGGKGLILRCTLMCDEVQAK